MVNKLTFTTGRRYDTKYLLDGTVRVRGYDIAYDDPGSLPWPRFHDMVTKLSFDIGEQAFSHFLIAKDQGKPLVAIPAFPSRFFPQLGFTVADRAGIAGPEDLIGKRVGVLGFGYNPAVWMRGILSEFYKIPIEKIVWVEDEDDPFLRGLDYPRSSRFTVERAKFSDQYLAQRKTGFLTDGTLDAIIAPSGGPQLHPGIRNLFRDPEAEIAAYVKQTGAFPINTVITLKQDVVRAHSDLPGKLMDAFLEAKEHYHRAADQPEVQDHMGVRIKLLRDLGIFPDHYGLEANRDVIERGIRHCYDQGLISRRYTPESLFVH